MEPTPVTKIVPPPRPAGYIRRPGLDARLAGVLERRLTVVVAEAGFGKSTMLASWWDAAPCAWYTADRGDRDLPSLARRLSDALRLRVPDMSAELERLADAVAGTEPEERTRADSLASRLAGVLHEQLATDLILVIDDLHELAAASPSARLIEALCRHAPPRLHLVLSGRRRPPFPIERLRGRGQLLEITGDHLEFTTEEVRQLLDERLGNQAATEIADDLHALTGGWPAAVVLAVEALRESPLGAWPTMRAQLGAGAPVVSYLAEEVFAHHPAEVRTLIGRLAVLENFTPELAEAVRGPVPRARIRELMRHGPFVERRQDGSLTLRPLIRDYAREQLPLPEAEASDVRLAAADWHRARGDLVAGVDLLISAGAVDRLAFVLHADGPGLLARGRVITVLDGCRALPASLRDAAIEQLEGEARQVQGDWPGALACFERAASAFDPLPARLAWRMGVIHYLRGELDAALDVDRRGMKDAGAEPGEKALLLAWTARRANDAHYLLALRAAEEAPDVLQTVRIRTNRASHFMEEGSYPQALQELEAAIRLAELTSFASYLALSLCNRGETKLRMGQLDLALADLEASRTRYQQIGSDMVAYPLTILGELHRERGNLGQARAAFEEALAISEVSNDLQGLVPALAGLATVIAAEEPDRARELADRGVACGTGMHYVHAVLASGWIAASAGDAAALAATFARARHDRPGLADALALGAMVARDKHRQMQGLREAAAIWREIGNPVGEAKVELAAASAEAGPRSMNRQRQLQRQLEGLGVHAHGGSGAAAGLLALIHSGDESALGIRSLGGFAVLRDGQPVRITDWQSKRARELLKMLVARRGRPAPRAYLMEALWPGEDPDRLANRLSVALTTVRGVLDPERRFAAEKFVAGDKDSVWLNLGSVDVDLERFLAAAGGGLGAVRLGDTATGIPALEEAAAAYSGDFLEENLYDDWAVPAREDARATYVAVARALALAAASRDDSDVAAAYFLRILQVDRYDEQANLGLVGTLADTGRHGEAHRHYLNYRRVMDELGVEPAPFPSGRHSPPGGAAAPTTFSPP
jgi:ATP/maltotriose-dependent transcriptional regulator MalT/DNA-binding SARP family transcriptional activator